MINKLSPYHVGTQPIRVLQHNIVKQFEDTNPEFIQLTLDTIIGKGLKMGIGYFVNEHPIDFAINGHPNQTPYVDENKKIHLHETFLSYVWCVAYGLIVLYDEAVAKPSQNLFYGEERNTIDAKAISKAQQVFDYGISLIKMFTPWDKENLPNPEYFHEYDEFYVGRVNSVLVYAVNFILCHEFIHVEQMHIDKVVAGNVSKTELLEFEKEADRQAIELILSGVTDERRASAFAGILVGVCCLLYFKNETLSRTHPDTDKRIDSFLTAINLEDDSPIWGIASLAYRLWDNQFTKSLNYPTQVENFKEMYESIKTLVEEENKQIRKRIK